MENSKDPKMDSLLSSIRNQTVKLRGNLRNPLKPPEHPGKEIQSKSAISFQANKHEYSYSKSLIGNLILDNKSLQEDLNDYRRVMEEITSKYKVVQKELEAEKLKGKKIELLEQELAHEKSQSDKMQKATNKLKENYLSMLELMRQTGFEISEQEKEDTNLIDHLERENSHLREILSTSSFTDSVSKQIDAALLQEESALFSLTEQEHQKVIQNYLNSKSQPAKPKPKKNYLLG